MSILIVCLFPSQFQTAYTEGKEDADEYYKYCEPNVNEYSLEKDGNLKLTENFMVCEFKCHDGSDEILIDISREWHWYVHPQLYYISINTIMVTANESTEDMEKQQNRVRGTLKTIKTIFKFIDLIYPE